MEAVSSIRVLVADDHPVVRDGLSAIINQQKDMVVAATAANGEEAVALFDEHRPEVTLIDLQMPVMDGVTAIGTILKQCPKAAMIVLSNHDGDHHIRRALMAGARAYLLKDTTRDELIQTIRLVSQGRTLTPPGIDLSLAYCLSHPQLTKRETEILKLLAEGGTNREIASKLFITEGTVKSHVNRILSKMGVSDRTQAVAQGIRRGMVPF